MDTNTLGDKEVLNVEALGLYNVDHGYSHCVRVGPLVFIAGQCGMSSERRLVSDEFEPQARAALARVQAVVEAVGGSLSDIAAMTVFVTDIRFGPIFTAIRKELFGDNFPTSACIGVSALMTPGAKIEIQATAVLT